VPASLRSAPILREFRALAILFIHAALSAARCRTSRRHRSIRCELMIPVIASPKNRTRCDHDLWRRSPRRPSSPSSGLMVAPNSRAPSSVSPQLSDSGLMVVIPRHDGLSSRVNPALNGVAVLRLLRRVDGAVAERVGPSAVSSPIVYQLSRHYG